MSYLFFLPYHTHQQVFSLSFSFPYMFSIFHSYSVLSKLHHCSFPPVSSFLFSCPSLLMSCRYSFTPLYPHSAPPMTQPALIASSLRYVILISLTVFFQLYILNCIIFYDNFLDHFSFQYNNFTMPLLFIIISRVKYCQQYQKNCVQPPKEQS